MMTAFDQAWDIAKEVEVDTMRGERPYAAYRAVPTSAVDEILSEGLKPRPIGRNFYRGGNNTFGQSHTDMGLTDESDVIYSFGYVPDHATDNPRTKKIRQSLVPYWALGDPLLNARYFADVLNPYDALSDGPSSIIGMRELPGQVFEDPAWDYNEHYLADGDKNLTISMPLLSREPIEPKHLDEVIAINQRGDPISYSQGQTRMPDHIREEWGWDE